MKVNQSKSQSIHCYITFCIFIERISEIKRSIQLNVIFSTWIMGKESFQKNLTKKSNKKI